MSAAAPEAGRGTVWAQSHSVTAAPTRRLSRPSDRLSAFSRSLSPRSGSNPARVPASLGAPPPGLEHLVPIRGRLPAASCHCPGTSPVACTPLPGPASARPVGESRASEPGSPAASLSDWAQPTYNLCGLFSELSAAPAVHRALCWELGTPCGQDTWGYGGRGEALTWEGKMLETGIHNPWEGVARKRSTLVADALLQADSQAGRW